MKATFEDGCYQRCISHAARNGRSPISSTVSQSRYPCATVTDGRCSTGLIITSALMIWKTLMLITGSESPVVVVLSGSMEPGFQRGDILFLYMGSQPIRTGEIVVFKVDHRDIPIVHRAIKIHEARNDTARPDIKLLTKVSHAHDRASWTAQGDNNMGHDRSLYAPGQLWLKNEHIMGRAVGFFPYLGMVTIIMNDYPWAKFVLIGGLAIMVLTSKE